MDRKISMIQHATYDEIMAAASTVISHAVAKYLMSDETRDDFMDCLLNYQLWKKNRGDENDEDDVPGL